MIDWIIANKEWCFSGIGVLVISFLIKLVLPLFKKSGTNVPSQKPRMSIELDEDIGNEGAVTVHNAMFPNEEILKTTIHILFIDDEKFKVVDILKKSGWIYTQRTSDVNSIDDEKIQKANILFIDIHGVGQKLQFRDEGLGLSQAIKTKYPEKKVVIYSAQEEGDRFHEALRQADAVLRKNADPYEFQQLTERLAAEILKHK